MNGTNFEMYSRYDIFRVVKQGKNELAEDEKAEGFIGFVKVGHKNVFFSMNIS